MTKPSCSTRVHAFVKSPRFKLYCSYALSTWTDRLWQFALGLALVEIAKLLAIGDLQLIAINGLVNGLAVLFFASSIGKLIDTTKRISAARTALTLSNSSVALSAICLIIVLYWDIPPIWNGTLRIALISIVLLLCTVSTLSQMGTKIVFIKDWVVVICNNEKDKLADTNAWLLRIDLVAKVIAPIKAGFLITWMSVSACCLFVAIWTVCSWGVEFWLLNVVYRSVPALAVKRSPNQAVECMNPSSIGLLESELDSTKLEQANVTQSKPPTDGPGPKDNCCGNIIGPLKSAIYGWPAYFRQPIFPAALALALLYLTVLDFNSITTGYAYSQGLPANVLSVARGVGSINGILGTVLYPLTRSKIGLIRTGLLSFFLELSFLTLCIVSIWLPGSQFDPIGYFSSRAPSATSSPPLNSTAAFFNQTLNSSASIGVTDERINAGHSYCSIWTFLLGVVLARCGLYMADLSVTQLMQESIAEHERGVVNGVQNSVNMLMSMIRDLMVIALPDRRTFGLLMIASWLSIMCGFISYSVYARRIRGHILPFHRQFSSTFQNIFRRNAEVVEQDDNNKL